MRGLQEQLNAKNKSDSADAERDLSGELSFCKNCKYRSGGGCYLSENERNEMCACAENYKLLTNT